MENFRELCKSYNEFNDILSKKCADYCAIHHIPNPFLEELADISIEEDFINIGYKVFDRYDNSDYKNLAIPFSFFEKENYGEEEEKALKLKNKKINLKKEISTIDDTIASLTKEMNLFKNEIEILVKDLDSFELLSKKYSAIITGFDKTSLIEQIEKLNINITDYKHKIYKESKKENH